MQSEKQSTPPPPPPPPALQSKNFIFRSSIEQFERNAKNNNKYTQTSLLWTHSVPKKVSTIKRCPLYRGVSALSRGIRYIEGCPLYRGVSAIERGLIVPFYWSVFHGLHRRVSFFTKEVRKNFIEKQQQVHYRFQCILGVKKWK